MTAQHGLAKRRPSTRSEMPPISQALYARVPFLSLPVQTFASSSPISNGLPLHSGDTLLHPLAGGSDRDRPVPRRSRLSISKVRKPQLVGAFRNRSEAGRQRVALPIGDQEFRELPHRCALERLRVHVHEERA